MQQFSQTLTCLFHNKGSKTCAFSFFPTSPWEQLWQFAADLIVAAEKSAGDSQDNNAVTTCIKAIRSAYKQGKIKRNADWRKSLLNAIFFLTAWLSEREVIKTKNTLSPNKTAYPPTDNSVPVTTLASFPRFPDEAQEESVDSGYWDKRMLNNLQKKAIRENRLSGQQHSLGKLEHRLHLITDYYKSVAFHPLAEKKISKKTRHLCQRYVQLSSVSLKSRFFWQSLKRILHILPQKTCSSAVNRQQPSI